MKTCRSNQDFYEIIILILKKYYIKSCCMENNDFSLIDSKGAIILSYVPSDDSMKSQWIISTVQLHRWPDQTQRNTD